MCRQPGQGHDQSTSIKVCCSFSYQNAHSCPFLTFLIVIIVLTKFCFVCWHFFEQMQKEATIATKEWLISDPSHFENCLGNNGMFYFIRCRMFQIFEYKIGQWILLLTLCSVSQRSSLVQIISINSNYFLMRVFKENIEIEMITRKKLAGSTCQIL